MAKTDAALTAATNIGPVAVAVEADQDAFQFYKKGVVSKKCGKKLDHGVLVVGYGTDQKTGLDYYKVKNSWGPTWGQKGYLLIERNSKAKGGMCGILLNAVYPVL